MNNVQNTPLYGMHTNQTGRRREREKDSKWAAAANERCRSGEMETETPYIRCCECRLNEYKKMKRRIFVGTLWCYCRAVNIVLRAWIVNFSVAGIVIYLLYGTFGTLYIVICCTIFDFNNTQKRTKKKKTTKTEIVKKMRAVKPVTERIDSPWNIAIDRRVVEPKPPILWTNIYYMRNLSLFGVVVRKPVWNTLTQPNAIRRPSIGGMSTGNCTSIYCRFLDKFCTHLSQKHNISLFDNGRSCRDALVWEIIFVNIG